MSTRGRKFGLSPIEEDDLPQLQAGAADPEILFLLGGLHFPSSAADMTERLKPFRHDGTARRLAVQTDSLSFIRSEQALIAGGQTWGPG